MQALIEQPEYRLFRQAFAERKAPLVLLLGSGLSAPAGLPTWPKLRSILQKEADKKEAALNQIGQALLGAKADAARSNESMWVAFKLLKELLTPPVFDQIIEKNLTPEEDSTLPMSYVNLMKLKPRGVVTLNLDKFAGEALSKESDDIVTPVFGKELSSKWNYLQSTKSYLVYLHGGLHDPSTWVMTQDDLDELARSVGHAHFLRNLFTNNLVLLVGVSADDLALSARLMELREAGFRPKNIYWLTCRLDDNTSQWASDNYISLIKYSAKNDDDHAAVVRSIVEDCLTYVSKDELPPPVKGMSRAFDLPLSDSDIDPEELAQKGPEEIRKVISIHLDNLLSSNEDSKTLYEKYREFCEKYDYAVHRAFYRGKSEKFREWFGYRLDIPSLGRGNFGEVFSALAPNGDLVAVKIMHESIFGNNDMLGGFRRGVQSLRIVTENNVDGMVTIRESYELPPHYCHATY